MIFFFRSYLKCCMLFAFIASNTFSMDNSNLDVPQLIFNAMQTGDLELAQGLIEQTGNSINLCDKEKNTLLIIACKYNFTQLAQFLIKRGADVNNLNISGQTALFFAVINDNEDLVKLLLEYRAQILPDTHGTSLITVAQEKHVSPKILKMLESCAYLDSFIAENGTGHQDDITHINMAALAGLHADSYFDPSCKELPLEDGLCGSKGLLKGGPCYDGLTIQSVGLSPFNLSTATSTMQQSPDLISLANAIKDGNFSTITTLLALCDDVNAPVDDQSNTLLHCAIQAGRQGLQSVDTVVYLLMEKGAVINSTNIHGQTPLHLAISTYNPLQATSLDIVVKMLVDHKAGVNFRDAQGQTPLYLALQNKNERLVKLLTDHGAYTSEPFKEEKQLDPYAQAKTVLSKKDLKDIQSLVNQGFDVNAPVDAKGNRPLHYVIGTRNHELQSIRRLLALGANPNCVNTSGKTPLHEAFYTGRMGIVYELLSHGIDGTLKDTFGRNPLVALVKQATPQLTAIHSVDELQESLADNNTTKALRCIVSGTHVNQADSVGMRPLHWAVTHQNTTLARMLLIYGADFTLKDCAEQTPLDYSVENNCTQITQLFSSLIDKREKCLSTIKSGGIACLKRLLKRSSINSPIDADGNCPLHVAVNLGYIPDYSKNSLTQMVTQESMNEMAKYIVLNGANVNAHNTQGQTPLLRAYMTGNRRLLKLFIAHGGDANVYTPQGENICVGLAILFQASKW